ncbi:hypothetical protein B0H14DRAFT_2649548 [Mycena olivaceomarginata]|nr:hypothetical protein B0H14DRAFT_2649548 [Mycena olivaceomarginata]
MTKSVTSDARSSSYSLPARALATLKTVKNATKKATAGLKNHAASQGENDASDDACFPIVRRTLLKIGFPYANDRWFPPQSSQKIRLSRATFRHPLPNARS